MNNLGTDEGWAAYNASTGAHHELQEAFDERTRNLEPTTKHAPSLHALHEQPGYSFEGRMEAADTFIEELSEMVSAVKEAMPQLWLRRLAGEPQMTEAYEAMRRRIVHAEAGLGAARAQIKRLREVPDSDRSKMEESLRKIMRHLRSDEDSFTRLFENNGLYGGGMMPGELDLQPLAKAAYMAQAPSTIGDYTLIHTTPTLKFYQDGKTNTIVIAIRGTADLRDIRAWAPVALGTLEKSARWLVDEETIQSVQQRYPPSQFDYYAVGHSLGGALADLALKKGYVKQALSYNPAVAPRDAMADDQRHQRVFNAHDPLGRLKRRFFPSQRDEYRRAKDGTSRLLPSHALDNVSTTPAASAAVQTSQQNRALAEHGLDGSGLRLRGGGKTEDAIKLALSNRPEMTRHLAGVNKEIKEHASLPGTRQAFRNALDRMRLTNAQRISRARQLERRMSEIVDELELIYPGWDFKHPESDAELPGDLRALLEEHGLEDLRAMQAQRRELFGNVAYTLDDIERMKTGSGLNGGLLGRGPGGVASGGTKRRREPPQRYITGAQRTHAIRVIEDLEEDEYATYHRASARHIQHLNQRAAAIAAGGEYDRTETDGTAIANANKNIHELNMITQALYAMGPSVPGSIHILPDDWTGDWIWQHRGPGDELPPPPPGAGVSESKSGSGLRGGVLLPAWILLRQLNAQREGLMQRMETMMKRRDAFIDAHKEYFDGDEDDEDTWKFTDDSVQFEYGALLQMLRDLSREEERLYDRIEHIEDWIENAGTSDIVDTNTVFHQALPPPMPDTDEEVTAEHVDDNMHGGKLTGAGMTDVDYCLSDTDIKRVAGSTGLLITRYPDLAQFSSWDQFLSNNAHAAAVLFLVDGPTSGHWIAAFDGPDETAHVWDPLGMALDAQRQQVEPDKLASLGQNRPQFARLLVTAESEGKTPVVNHVEFQDFKPSVNTCGRWVALRILHRDKTDPEFKEFVLQKVRASSCASPDEWVADYTNPKLTGGSLWLDDVSEVLGGRMQRDCLVTLPTNYLPADYALAPGKMAVAFYSSEREKQCVGIIPTGLSEAETIACFTRARTYLRSASKFVYHALRDPACKKMYHALRNKHLVSSVATAKPGVITCLVGKVSVPIGLLRSHNTQQCLFLLFAMWSFLSEQGGATSSNEGTSDLKEKVRETKAVLKKERAELHGGAPALSNDEFKALAAASNAAGTAAQKGRRKPTASESAAIRTYRDAYESRRKTQDAAYWTPKQRAIAEAGRQASLRSQKDLAENPQVAFRTPDGKRHVVRQNEYKDKEAAAFSDWEKNNNPTGYWIRHNLNERLIDVARRFAPEGSMLDSVLPQKSGLPGEYGVVGQAINKFGDLAAKAVPEMGKEADESAEPSPQPAEPAEQAAEGKDSLAITGSGRGTGYVRKLAARGTKRAKFDLEEGRVAHPSQNLQELILQHKIARAKQGQAKALVRVMREQKKLKQSAGVGPRAHGVGPTATRLRGRGIDSESDEDESSESSESSDNELSGGGKVMKLIRQRAIAPATDKMIRDAEGAYATNRQSKLADLRRRIAALEQEHEKLSGRMSDLFEHEEDTDVPEARRPLMNEYRAKERAILDKKSDLQDEMDNVVWSGLRKKSIHNPHARAVGRGLSGGLLPDRGLKDSDFVQNMPQDNVYKQKVATPGNFNARWFDEPPLGYKPTRRRQWVNISGVDNPLDGQSGIGLAAQGGDGKKPDDPFKDLRANDAKIRFSMVGRGMHGGGSSCSHCGGSGFMDIVKHGAKWLSNLFKSRSTSEPAPQSTPGAAAGAKRKREEPKREAPPQAKTAPEDDEFDDSKETSYNIDRAPASPPDWFTPLQKKVYLRTSNDARLAMISKLTAQRTGNYKGSGGCPTEDDFEAELSRLAPDDYKHFNAVKLRLTGQGFPTCSCALSGGAIYGGDATRGYELIDDILN